MYLYIEKKTKKKQKQNTTERQKATTTHLFIFIYIYIYIHVYSKKETEHNYTSHRKIDIPLYIINFKIDPQKNHTFPLSTRPPKFHEKIGPKKPLGKGAPGDVFVEDFWPRLPETTFDIKFIKIDLICKIYENLKKTLSFYYIFKLKLIRIYVVLVCRMSSSG